MPSKHTQRPTLFIRGVVSAQNHAQAMVRNGIPAHQHESFLAHIQAVVQSVENICNQHQTTPKELPIRTYRAYQYLKSLLDQDLPKPQVSKVVHPSLTKNSNRQSLRLRGLISFCQGLQERITLLIEQPGESLNQPNPDYQVLNNIIMLPVFQEIQTALTNLDQLAQAEKYKFASLLAPSLRAYQWLNFLSIPENLQAHLLALTHINQIQTSIIQSPERLTKIKHPPLRVEFFHIPGLYRSQQQGTLVKMVAHEGFVFAPHSILESLMNLAYNRHKAKAIACLRNYADSSEFIQSARQLVSTGQPNNSQANGHHQDLQQIFARVNVKYFGNRLQAPQLSWSSSLTFRKFGHYQPSTDNLMLSASLDDANVPGYVLDFAMYHELLHKHLGYYTRNGRRISHHAEFRKHEAQFPQFEQAQKYLAKIGKIIKTGKPGKYG